jgi:3-oxoacyl-[acyl-carrier-protein] synthase III
VARSGIDPAQFGLVLHTSTWYQGLDIWPVASYIANAAVGRSVPGLDVQQRCNGGLAVVELAAAALVAGTAGSAALLTTADRFCGPVVDRWNMHPFNVYGDGGTALVLSTQGGFARLLATATAADNSLEPMARGAEPFRTVPATADEPVDLIRRTSEYYAEHDATAAQTRIGRVMHLAWRRALRDSGTKVADIARVVMPAAGRMKGEAQFHHLLGVTEEQTTWDFGSRTGHIGAGDWYAGLEHLVERQTVAPGDRVVLFGGGAGYTCTVAVVEITALPDW